MTSSRRSLQTAFGILHVVRAPTRIDGDQLSPIRTADDGASRIDDDASGALSEMTMAAADADRREGNLPAALTSFVGRRNEVGGVKARLSAARLVTLTGMGGVGKTRLALQVAWELRRSFQDGVWLVEFAALRDPEFVPQTVAAALRVQDRSEAPLSETLVQQLRERHLLLVFDNCEHLLEPCALLMSVLLRGCPQLRILATSRQALDTDGEHLFAVPPLSMPDTDLVTSPTEMLRYGAVALFVARATAVQPEFEIDATTMAAVVKVCRRLDGVPLAIELAASKLRALSIHELLLRMNDRFELLVGGNRAGLPRQRTLRALIDWSFELCSREEQLLWARLSVFLGGFDIAAAEAVCTDSSTPSRSILEVLTGLVDKSIVVVRGSTTGARYEIPDLLRAYGSERLMEFGESDALRSRHLDWCHTLIAEAEAGWFSADQSRTIARLRLEHANLREALNFCLTEHQDPRPGLEMAAALRFYWSVTGRLNEGRQWLGRLLAQFDQPDPVKLTGLCILAFLSVLAGDFATGTKCLSEARGLSTELHDRGDVGLLLQIEGLSALFQDEPERAIPRFSDALRIHRADADHPAAVYDQVVGAMSAAMVGDSDRAVSILEACLEDPHHPSGERWLRGLGLYVLGVEEYRRGNHPRAEAVERESLRLRVALDDQWNIGLNLQVLAWTAAGSGDALRAARLHGAAEAMTHSVGSSLASLGHLTRLQHSFELETRGVLTDPGFERAAAEGRRLTRDEAVSIALGESSTTRRSVAVTASGTPSPLTQRERQVAELLGKGMTNKEIAQALVISQRTAEGHVEHILTKLGLTSRTQVVLWTIENTETR